MLFLLLSGSQARRRERLGTKISLKFQNIDFMIVY
jgi:hypothetical protein